MALLNYCLQVNKEKVMAKINHNSHVEMSSTFYCLSRVVRNFEVDG